MLVGHAAFEKRSGKKFDGPVILFGTSVEYLPITAKDKSEIHQFGKKTLEGVFFRYVLREGGVWSGDLLLADCKDLQESEATEKKSKGAKARKYS